MRARKVAYAAIAAGFLALAGLGAGVSLGSVADAGSVTSTTDVTTTAPKTPTISSFAPSSGQPGTRVSIFGSGFTGATSVAFNSSNASFTVGSDSSISATVPSGSTSGRIVVTTPGGTATSSGTFTVTAAEVDIAGAYQVDAAHSGVQTDSALAPPLARRWVATLPNPPSYPLIARGKIFVTTSNAPSSGTTLYALDQADGHVVWSQAINGSYSFSAAAYDSGRVFAVNFDGLLQAFDADTGVRAWGMQLPRQWAFTSPPTAANGVVYTGGAGSGGTIYAVDEVTGAVLATQSVMNGDDSSPALSDGSVFVSYACNQAYGFAKTTLAPLWHYSTFCEGGGGKTTVYADGRVYTRDFNGNLVLDAGTGTLLHSFTAPNTTALAPAVDKTSLFALTWPTGSTGGHLLSAQNVADGSSRWTFTGDGQLDTAPIVIVTPNGEYVVEGSASGMLYMLDAMTGAQVWSTNVGDAIAQPDEQNAVQLTGLAAGQGILAVPAGRTLSAYGAPPPPAPSIGSFTPSAGGVGTSVAISGSNFTGATTVKFNGTAASFTVNGGTQITATVPAGATTGAISVTTRGGTATSSGAFTVLPPDFAISVTPATRSVVAGSSVSYTVTITPSGGFTGSVSLSLSGLPARSSATFSPVSATTTSTLTVTTTRSTSTGNSTLTITGTSANLRHATSVALQVTKK